MSWNSLDQGFSLRQRVRIADPSIQDGIPKATQRNEHWKCMAAKQNLIGFLSHFESSCHDLTFPTRIQDEAQGAAKGMEIENVWWVKET